MNYSVFKPYKGLDERHIALCFDPADKKRALPIIKQLYKRGIRTWYCCGFFNDYKKESSRMESILSADLLIVIRSKESFSSRFVKSTALYFEDVLKKIVFIDFDVESSNALSIGLKNEHTVIDGHASCESIVDSIIHTEGFVQDIFTEPFVPNSRSIKLAAIAVFVLTTVISLSSFLVGKGYIVPAASSDTVQFLDKTVERGARYSIAGSYNVSLNEDNLSQIETLYLDKSPKSCVDFSKFSNLKTVVLPQCTREVAEYILSYDLELLIYGGELK